MRSEVVRMERGQIEKLQKHNEIKWKGDRALRENQEGEIYDREYGFIGGTGNFCL